MRCKAPWCLSVNCRSERLSPRKCLLKRSGLSCPVRRRAHTSALGGTGESIRLWRESPRHVPILWYLSGLNLGPRTASLPAGTIKRTRNDVQDCCNRDVNTASLTTSCPTTARQSAASIRSITGFSPILITLLGLRSALSGSPRNCGQPNVWPRHASLGLLWQK